MMRFFMEYGATSSFSYSPSLLPISMFSKKLTASRVMAASGLFAAAPEAAADLADLKSDFERRWNDGGKPVRHAAWRRLPLPPHIVGH